MTYTCTLFALLLHHRRPHCIQAGVSMLFTQWTSRGMRSSRHGSCAQSVVYRPSRRHLRSRLSLRGRASTNFHGSYLPPGTHLARCSQESEPFQPIPVRRDVLVLYRSTATAGVQGTCSNDSCRRGKVGCLESAVNGPSCCGLRSSFPLGLM